MATPVPLADDWHSTPDSACPSIPVSRSPAIHPPISSASLMGNNESTRKLTIINEFADGSIRITDEAGKKLDQSIRRIQEPERQQQQQQQPHQDQRSPPQQPHQQQQRQGPGLTESDFLTHGVDDEPMESLSRRKRQSEEIRVLERQWNARLKEYEEQNKYLWYTTTKRLSDDLTKIENKYTKVRRYEAVCPEVEEKLFACYQQNKKQTLKCSPQVKEFTGCIRDARLKALSAGV